MVSSHPKGMMPNLHEIIAESNIVLNKFIYSLNKLALSTSSLKLLLNRSMNAF
jgi:hypothetical protein